MLNGTKKTNTARYTIVHGRRLSRNSHPGWPANVAGQYAVHFLLDDIRWKFVGFCGLYFCSRARPADQAIYSDGSSNALFAGCRRMVVLANRFFDKREAGITIYIHARLFDTPNSVIKPLSHMINNSGAEAELYISASDLLTFAVKEVYGSVYKVEARLYRTEVPIDEPARIFCEIGIADDTSVLRILVNDREIRRITIPIAINIGDEGWRPTTIGGGVPSNLYGYRLFQNAITNHEISEIVSAEKKRN